MSTTSWLISPYYCDTSAGVVCRSRSPNQASTFYPAGCHLSKHNEYYCRFLGNPRLQSASTSLQRVQNCKKNTKMDISVKNNILPDLPPLPSDNSSPGSWKLWLMGILISVVVPFWKNKWGPLQKLQKEVETVVDTAQEVTDIIEDVAKGVEKLADELGDHLPEGGKLQQAAEFVEDMAKGTVHKANLVEDVLEKVEEVENQVEEFLEDQTTKRKEETTVEKKTRR
ncbi:hypothetical protein PanWU01x14_227830 [Parasponia andersonii]|uniref:Uncharacterized protein n=1 Tax=Parasponia andersonii TaxID=3476 RepID=A0A2P5BLS7_PARAD|nr:hypothetical protein PanWU01x14_227830 [Parasponia andersonii]